MQHVSVIDKLRMLTRNIRWFVSYEQLKMASSVQVALVVTLFVIYLDVFSLTGMCKMTGKRIGPICGILSFLNCANC